MSASHTLVQYRQVHNLTQKELAEEMGVNPATLLRIEKNVGSYTIRKIMLWCQRSGVNPFEIFPPDAAA